ncbi:CorA family divalent cation transporter [Luteimonas sp. MJ174]|uniref:magnesium transporter CorA family protein n=1 Tax=Luteimonas sp. MJ174 TaxID=3129237 RepID=UPI0031BA5E14
MACNALGSACPGENADAMLWVDVLRADESTLRQVWAECRLPKAALDSLDAEPAPRLERFGEHFLVCAIAVVDDDLDGAQGAPLTLVAGDNIVISVHDGPIGFIDDLMSREAVASHIGRLGADSFVAALLDWQLSTYFDAVSAFEAGLDELEEDILAENAKSCLPELRRLRKSASLLRKMLAPHRAVFGALSRPDFRHDDRPEAERHFAALDTRFERAMDIVENARDLVVGSFELFTSQTALRTDSSMRVLTFVTVITGLLATVAGILGMNFKADFFGSGDAGFLLAVGGMLLFGGGSLVLARARDWL